MNKDKQKEFDAMLQWLNGDCKLKWVAVGDVSNDFIQAILNGIVDEAERINSGVMIKDGTVGHNLN